MKFERNGLEEEGICLHDKGVFAFHSLHCVIYHKTNKSTWLRMFFAFIYLSRNMKCVGSAVIAPPCCQPNEK